MDKRVILDGIKNQEQRYLAAQVLNKMDLVRGYRNFEKTDFLDPTQQAFVRRIVKQYGLTELNCNFFGGYKGAERKVAVFSCTCGHAVLNEEDHADAFNRNNEIITCIRIEPHINEKQNQLLNLSHRDYLGALMGLGIERSKIGDILPEENGVLCHIFIAVELQDYIAYNFTNAGNYGISLAFISLNDLMINRKTMLKESRKTVASLRLDCILAAALNLPRGKAADFIHAGKVTVNWEICENAARALKEEDVLSVKGFGRIYICRVEGMTKKGRIAIILGTPE